MNTYIKLEYNGKNILMVLLCNVEVNYLWGRLFA